VYVPRVIGILVRRDRTCRQRRRPDCRRRPRRDRLRDRGRRVTSSSPWQPFKTVQLRRAGSAALGGVALVATLVSLVVTTLVTDGLEISGVGAWIAATVIV
jgi:hypothetical protein